MKSFSVALSALRKETGLSQRQAAFDLGVSQALLSHYENGAREPKLGFVVKACDYYGVSADYILGRDDERTPQNLPAPRGCEGAPLLIDAAHSVFEKLDDLFDPELYAAAVNYLLIPIQNTAALLRDPQTPYEPARDAELKLAEAEFVKHIRRAFPSPQTKKDEGH